MKLQNLLRTDLSDVANRGWQELWRTVDRVAVDAMPERTLGFFEHLSPQVPRGDGRGDPEAEYEMFCRHSRVRFFAGPGDARLSGYFADYLPQARQKVLATADALCRRSFSLLGHRALYLGEQLDWHLDVISGRRAPLLHWSRIRPLDVASVGDSKVTWELNRHQWLVHLGQAWRLSGDERYATLFADSIRDWMRSNPPGRGINWASSMEVSYRLISWCWALNLFRGSEALTPPLYVEILAWLRAHAAHVERYLSHYFSPNTHLTGEALGLFYAGVLFPELPRAARWRRLGTRILLEQLNRQVLADGVYFEQSTCYQRYTVEIYLHFMLLAARNGVLLPAAVGERVQLMLDHLLAVCRPDGSMPQVGDTDGGRLLPLAQRGADDCRDVLALGAALFRRADYSWAARGLQPEVVWLMGMPGCKSFDVVSPAPPAEPPSRLFPLGGQVVMQSGWEPDAHQLLLDVGPLGCHVSGGHGHADLLSIQCSPYGRAQLIDPGTYCYTANAHWRDHFRSTAAHNTVVVDHKNQAVPAGPFGWRERPAATLREWLSHPDFDYADAEHDAYRRLRDPVKHRRRILFVKPHYWVVVDDLYGADAHQLELMFQFTPGRVTLEEDGWAGSLGADGRGLWLRTFSAVPLQAESHFGGIEPIRGWVSPDYGLRVPAPLLRYSVAGRLPLRLITLLVPRPDAETAPPASELTDGGASLRLTLEQGEDVVRVDERQVTLERAGRPGIVPLPRH